MPGPSGPIELQPDPPTSGPAVAQPSPASAGPTPIHWPELGLCALVAGGMVWIAHFALSWDRLLVALVFLVLGFALGHWFASRKHQTEGARHLLRGRWTRRARWAGALLATAGAIELLAYSIAIFGTVYDKSFTLERFPWRPLLAGSFCLMLGAWVFARGWRASTDPVKSTN